MKLFMRRMLCYLFIAALFLVTAHHLPAPIQEVETPTPAPEQSANPKPKRTKTTNESSKALTKRQTASPTPKTQPAPTQLRFAGMWAGTMHAGNGKTYPVTVIVDPTQTKASATGPVFGNEGGHLQTNGNTISWNWMLDSWSMTLNSETTAQVVKRYLGTIDTGTVERIK